MLINFIGNPLYNTICLRTATQILSFNLYRVEQSVLHYIVGKLKKYMRH
jgi:hypothetical protein